MSQDILPILKNLISLKSITPREADSIEHIADFLSKLGFKCEI